MIEGGWKVAELTHLIFEWVFEQIVTFCLPEC